MASRTVPFPLYVGRKDSVDAKLAPMGILATCKNLRVRKDGRLSCRHGYQPLSTSAGGSDFDVFDLHDFNGRLLALHSNATDGYPTQASEYAPTAASGLRWFTPQPWHDLTPFTALRDLDVASPPSSGVDEIDSAAGGGHVCVITRSVGGVVMAVVIRESDGQAVFISELSSNLSRPTAHFRVTFAQDTFYVASLRADNSLDILSYAIGGSSFDTLVNQAFSSSATAPVFDIVPVDNPTSTAFTGARVCIAFDRGTTTDLTIRVYTGSGAQVGSDITLAGTDTISASVNCDQTANRISLAIVVTGGAATLRTYNMSTRALLVGATSVTGIGTHITLTRIPAPPSGANQLAVIATTTGNDTLVSVVTEAAHAGTASASLGKLVHTTRCVHWTSTTGTASNRQYAVVFGGYVAPDIASTSRATNALFFVVTGGVGSVAGNVHMATRDFTRATPRTLRNVGLHLDTSNSRVTWCALRDSGSGTSMPAVTSFARHSAARRQGVTFGGLRYFAGAPMQVYDGRTLTEHFQEVPGIISATPSNSTGTLTNSATYTYVAHWETTLADGSFWQSAPSDPFPVTMGAADDTVTLVVSTPHHSAVANGSTSQVGADIVCVVSRTVFAGGVEGSLYRQVKTSTVPVGLGNYGDNLTIVDEMPDATAAVQTALYTQAARGSLSGCLEHNAPRAGEYVAASESRLYVAGQLRANGFQVSKEAFIEEPFTFSEFSTFFGQVAGRVRALYSLDGVRLLFTTDELFAVPGAGPDDLGGGQLESPVRIPSPSGIEDWRSMLESPEGLWFQLDDGKLYLLPRGGGAPVWAGVEIQDTLASYPVITGACKSRRDDALLFACQNTSAGTDGRIIVRSQRTGIWCEDTPPLTASEGIEAICSFEDSVVYVTGGAPYQQSTTSFADGTSTVIPTQLKTQPLYPFGVGGTGLIHDVLIDGEYRSAGTLALRVSYDDGANFSSLPSFSLTGLAVGATVQRKWALPLVGARSLVVELTYTPSTAGEGFIAKSGMLLVTPDQGLPELLPSEMA